MTHCLTSDCVSLLVSPACDDECSGLLISDMDRLLRIISEVTLTTPLPPPYKVLYRFENMTEELKVRKKKCVRVVGIYFYLTHVITTSGFITLTYFDHLYVASLNSMPSNILHLNSGKTEILVLGHGIFSSEVGHYTSPPANNIKYSTENLCIVFCFVLFCEALRSKSCFFHLRNILIGALSYTQ